MSDNKYLRIYLNDHLAGAVAGEELAKRCLKNNQGTDLGRFLTRLIEEIGEDRRALGRIMDAAGAPRDRAKGAAAWVAEKVGRLKLNGQIRGYSPLSRLVELEGLVIGVEGKLRGWRALQSASVRVPADVDLDRLVERAESQVEELEAHRRAASATALR
jgi:hypothetical protein